MAFMRGGACASRHVRLLYRKLRYRILFYPYRKHKTLDEEELIMTPMNNADYLIRLQNAEELTSLKKAKVPAGKRESKGVICQHFQTGFLSLCA